MSPTYRQLPHLRDHRNICLTRSRPATAGPQIFMSWSTKTTPSAERSLHHCFRSEKIQRAVGKAHHSLDESLLSSQSSSVGHVRTGRLVFDECGSLISNVTENPRRDSENQQIRILLERQKEQTLAVYRVEILKHEFQADYDRRSVQKLNEGIQSQRGEIYRAHQ